MTKIIAVVDLGHFKAYRVSKNPNESARMELLDSYDILDTHGKCMDKYTDSEGSFCRGEGKAGVATGSGEPHNVETEIEKKVTRRIANEINTLVRKENCHNWYLAAAEAINNQIVENLDPEIKTKMKKNVKADLTKTDKSEILNYFER